MARELIIPFLITANYQTSLAIRQLRGELGQLPAELTALRAAAAEVYAMGAMGLFSLGMLAVGAQQLASSLLAAQRMAALAAVASGQFAASTAISNQILKETASVIRGTGVDLQSATAAFLEAARAGLTLREAATLLPEALRLSVVSGGEVAEVFRMTFAIMRNMGIPITQETARVLTSELSYALDQSLMDIEDVMHAIKYVGPVAGQLRVPLHDLFAALMLLHDAGIRASIAGTGLSRMLIRLEAPTQQARKRLAELGIDWQQLRPTANNLADIIDILATRADELTIRLLLGERAERAFYAIVQQGTERLRRYAEALRGVGEESAYLEMKFKALMKTPAFRFQAALQDLRTSTAMLVEPLVNFQLMIFEGFAKVLRTVVDSPVLRFISKFAVGLAALGGTTLLVVSSLSWLAGRFLELSTIGHHFLLVIDRLQAALQSLTLSALKTPFLGFWEFLKGVFTGTGFERLALFISERMRISELASALSQPLVFFRRARRIHPLLQPLPEFLGAVYGSMSSAAARLGIPIESFLLAGMTYGGMRTTIPALKLPDMSTLLKSLYLQFLENVLTANASQLIDSIRQNGAALSAKARAHLIRELPKRVINTISQIQTKDFAQFLQLAQRKIFDAIANQDIILTESELTMLGFEGSNRLSRQEAARLFTENLFQRLESSQEQFKRRVASFIALRPELALLSRISRSAQKTINEFFEQVFVHLPIESVEEGLKALYRDLESAAQKLHKPALPFLTEYQRKVQYALREANISDFTRSLLLGAAMLPVDALEEAGLLTIGMTTGLAARRIPTTAAQFERLLGGLATEFAAYLQNIENIVSGAIWLGLSFGSAVEKLPSAELLSELINARSFQISNLKRLKFMGLASATQLAQLSQLEIQLGLLLGMLFSRDLRKAQVQLLQGLQLSNLNTARIKNFYAFMQTLGRGGFRDLQSALLNLGYDVPELIGRLLREGAPFYQLVKRQLSNLPRAEQLQRQWFEFTSNVLRANRAISLSFPPQIANKIVTSLKAMGLTEQQATEILSMVQSGMLLAMAEQAALGKNFSDFARNNTSRLSGLISRIASIWANIPATVRRATALVFARIIALFKSFHSVLLFSIPNMFISFSRWINRTAMQLLVTSLIAFPDLMLRVQQVTDWFSNKLIAPITGFFGAVSKLVSQLRRKVYTLANIPRRIPTSARFTATAIYLLQTGWNRVWDFLLPWMLAGADAFKVMFRDFMVAAREFLSTFADTFGRAFGGVLDLRGLRIQLSRMLKFFYVSVQRFLKQLQVTFGETVLKPIWSQLSMLPQFLLGKDILRFVKPVGFGRMLLGSAFMATLLMTIISFILDVIPWDELGTILRWKPTTVVRIKLFGRAIRSAITLLGFGVFTTIKAVTYDLVAGLIDNIRGQGPGIIERIKNSFKGLAELWRRFRGDLQAAYDEQVLQLTLQTRIGLSELGFNLRDLQTVIKSETQAIVNQLNSARRSLAEMQKALSLSAEIAPAGYNQAWKDIGRMAVQYTNLSETFQDLYQRQLQFQSVLNSILGPLSVSEGALEKARASLAVIANLPEEAWTETQGGRISGRLAENLNRLHVSLFGPKGFFFSMRAIYDAIDQLPEEQRVQLLGTQRYLRDVLKTADQLRITIALFEQAPTKYRQQLLEQLSQLAGVLSSETFKANVFEPLRTQIETINEQLNESKALLSEIRDPFVRRQLGLELAREQFEALTGEIKQLSDALATMRDFLNDLTMTTSTSTASAELLASAFMRVVDVLNAPSVGSLENALQLLSSAFELTGEREARVKIAELQRLLHQYNFMLLTPEAAAEIRKRIAELGREVLEEFNKIREALVKEAEEFRQLADEYAEAWTFIAPEAIDRGIAAERAYLAVAQREAQIRAEMMRKLGYSEAQINEMLSRFWSKTVSRLYFLRRPTLEQLQSYLVDIAEFSEQVEENFAGAFVARERAALIAFERASRYAAMASQILMRTGGVVTRAVVDYATKARQAFRQVYELSLDAKIAAFGLQVAWREISEAWSGFGNTIAGLSDKFNFFWLAFSSGIAKLNSLWAQVVRLMSYGTIGARIRAIQVWRQFREVWKTIFPEPEELADAFQSYADMLQRIIEQGFVPTVFGIDLRQARVFLMQTLHWLWANYLQRFQSLTTMIMHVPAWTRIWLELFEAQTKVVQSLAEIEERIRNIRLEMLSLELIALPERVAQFLITQGPAMFGFMRTGAFGGISTIQFNIVVNSQDVQAGIMAAMNEASRRLQGFTYPTVIW